MNVLIACVCIRERKMRETERDRDRISYDLMILVCICRLYPVYKQHHIQDLLLSMEKEVVSILAAVWREH